jgi:hypothetical protein
MRSAQQGYYAQVPGVHFSDLQAMSREEGEAGEEFGAWEYDESRGSWGRLGLRAWEWKEGDEEGCWVFGIAYAYADAEGGEEKRY